MPTIAGIVIVMPSTMFFLDVRTCKVSWDFSILSSKVLNLGTQDNFL